MRTDPALMISCARNVLRFAAALTFSPLCLSVTHAQTVNLSGRYQCAEAKVSGKSIPCNAAPLILKSDGKFELRGWEGSYSITGEFVELSDSVVRSRAKIEPGHKIRFRYRGKHGWCEMIYERRVAELGKTFLS
jgi:hypothetical protein